MVEVTISPETWEYIKRTFQTYGFSSEEGTWAANNNLDPGGPKSKQIMRLLRNRMRKVNALVRYTGFSRRSVILDCEEESKFIARQKGEDENNLFMGASP